MADIHVSRALCQMLTNVCPQEIGPRDLEVFEDVCFCLENVRRKITFSEQESPTLVKAYVSYVVSDGLTRKVIWAMDTHRPVLGKPYRVFTVKRYLDREKRWHDEIPVVADPLGGGIGVEEDLRVRGTLIVEATLQELSVPPRGDKDGYTILRGIAPGGKRMVGPPDIGLPVGERHRFSVIPRGLETLKVFALAEARMSKVKDPFIVEVGGSLYRWQDALGIDDRYLLGITLPQFEEVVESKIAALQVAYSNAVSRNRSLLGESDKAAEEEIKKSNFPRLVALEACAEAGRAWISKRDTEKRETLTPTIVSMPTTSAETTETPKVEAQTVSPVPAISSQELNQESEAPTLLPERPPWLTDQTPTDDPASDAAIQAFYEKFGENWQKPNNERRSSKERRKGQRRRGQE